MGEETVKAYANDSREVLDFTTFVINVNLGRFRQLASNEGKNKCCVKCIGVAPKDILDWIPMTGCSVNAFRMEEAAIYTFSSKFPRLMRFKCVPFRFMPTPGRFTIALFVAAHWQKINTIQTVRIGVDWS